MAHKKAGGTVKNLRDSNPKYLGVKLFEGQRAQPGSVIIRQRGTKFVAGPNTGMGKDHTIYATKEGVVAFKNKRKIGYDSRRQSIKKVEVK